MPITGQYFGGKRRFYFSRAPEADWTLAGQTLDGVLNPIDGSEMLGPPAHDNMINTGQAQGQGEYPTALIKGAENVVATPRFWLTPEALGRFVSSCWGTDAKSNPGASTCYQHELTVTKTPVPFTVEEHLQGATGVVNAWEFAGCWCSGFTIDVANGNQYATLSPTIVASKYIGGGASQAALDVAANWPVVPGIPPTKIGLWVAPTTGNNHTSAYTAASVPDTAGVPYEDLAGQINLGIRARSFSFNFDTGVDLTQLYQAGTSTTAGFVRGQPYTVNKTCSLTVTFDVDAVTDEFLTHFRDWSDATPESYTMQMTGVTDTLAGTGYYLGFSLVASAMYVESVVKPDGGLGAMTASITFRGMQPALAADYAIMWTWDKVDQDYA